jgi:hypothetical protein
MNHKFPLQKHTFGSSKAAEALADIVSEYGSKHLCAKVSKFLSEHNAMLHQVNNIPDVHVRLVLINMIGDKIKASRMINWPERVVTYTKNVAQAQVKRYRESDEAIVADDIARINRARAAREAVRKEESNEA